jgi:hypothetical protein
MIEIRMNKEMPLSVEWIPQNAYMHNPLDHLLPGDQNQNNFVFIKQETDLFDGTLNSQLVTPRAVMCLQVPSKEKDKEIKQQNSLSDMLMTVSSVVSCTCMPVIVIIVSSLYLCTQHFL